MQELIINRENNKKTICLVNDAELVERYDETNLIKRIEGNIYAGRIEDILPGMQAAFINIGEKKNGLIHFEDILPKIDITINNNKDANSDNKFLKDKLIKGKKILVQVKKDSDNIKGARLTTHISLVGKYLVMMPNTTIVTVSQKIEDKDEKDRLKITIKKILPENIGAIIRTSAISKSEEELQEDFNELLDRWKKIIDFFEKDISYPILIEENNNIVKKILLDTIEKDIRNVYVNSNEDYIEIKDYIKMLKPVNDINVLLMENENLLTRYQIDKQIEKSEKRKIWLNCGGFITIDKTEALTAIDVNSSKYTGGKSLEDTILKVNLEATKEIAKQMRLRDIGGIIIVDYIDMKEDSSREEVIKEFELRLKQDRSKTQVLDFTKLNLLEVTRKHIFSSNQNIEKKEEVE